MDNTEVLYKKERIVRILNHVTNQVSVGTGFFITQNDIITCSHVLLMKDLASLEKNEDFNKTNLNEDLIKKFHKSFTRKIEIEFSDKSKKEVFLKHIDPKNDFAILRLSSGSSYGKYFEVDVNKTFYYNDYVSFCGFQNTPYVHVTESPFTYNDGKISSFPDLIVAGDKYQHIQINSINLGGNSGAPLFMDREYKAVGIINGNQNHGSDNVAFFDDKGTIVRNAFRIPLSIAYATSFESLRKRSSVFNKYIESKIK